MTSLDVPVPLAHAFARWGLIASVRGGMIACRFLLTLFISRYLDLASLGLFGLIAGAVAIVPALISFGMLQPIMRDAVTMSPVQLTDALRHYWCYTAAVYAALLPAAAAATHVLGVSPMWIAIVAIILFEQLGNDVFQLFTNLNRTMLAHLTAFLRGAAWILLYVPLAFWNPHLRTLPYLLLFWLVGSASSFVAFAANSRTWPWRDAFALPFRFSWVWSRMRSSLVIYASDLSFIAGLYLDRYLVTLFLGLQLAGVYVLYLTAANVIYTFISMAVLQQQSPFLIKAHNESVAAHRRLCVRFMWATALCTVALGLALAAAFLFVLPLLRQPLASTNIFAFWWILSGMMARCIADWGGLALFTSRRDRIMTATNLVAMVALALSQTILLPLAGLTGAGIALLLTFGATILWRYVLIFLPFSRATTSREHG